MLLLRTQKEAPPKPQHPVKLPHDGLLDDDRREAQFQKQRGHTMTQLIGL